MDSSRPACCSRWAREAGPFPNERLPVRTLMSQTVGETDPAAVDDYADLAVFPVMVLAPERTLAEKLAFLHHRSSVGDYVALRNGARHLYDSAMLLSSDRVTEILAAVCCRVLPRAGPRSGSHRGGRGIEASQRPPGQP